MKNDSLKYTREWYEHLWGIKEDQILNLQNLISTGLFKTIISSPKDVEFKIRHGDERVAVFLHWEFECNISKEDYHQFVDEDSILNTHFSLVEKVVENPAFDWNESKHSNAKQLTLDFDND